MPSVSLLSLLPLLVLAELESCPDDGTSVSLSHFAHAPNEEFISKVAQRTRWMGPQQQMPVVIRADGSLRPTPMESTKFLAYNSDNGWNNQLLNVLCAIDMARLLNRTLILPTYKWQRRRGGASISLGRLLNLRSLAPLVSILAEDEHGSIQAALTAASIPAKTIEGQGQPHRKSGMKRWDREKWVSDFGAEEASVLRVTCCLFWTWTLPDATARLIHRYLRYSPALEAAARAAAAPLGGDFAALHVRRGDKVHVDRAYTRMFSSMEPDYFLQLMRLEGFSRGGTVYVATDEPTREVQDETGIELWGVWRSKGGRLEIFRKPTQHTHCCTDIGHGAVDTVVRASRRRVQSELCRRPGAAGTPRRAHCLPAVSLGRCARDPRAACLHPGAYGHRREQRVLVSRCRGNHERVLPRARCLASTLASPLCRRRAASSVRCRPHSPVTSSTRGRSRPTPRR